MLMSLQLPTTTQSDCSITYQIIGWCSGLEHCTAALAVPPETLGSRPGSVTAGRDREVCGVTHNWPSVIRVREGLAGRDILVSLRTSDSCGRPGAVHANQSHQVHGVSSNTLVRLASGLDACCVKKQCVLVGLCFGGSRPLPLPSPVPI